MVQHNIDIEIVHQVDDTAVGAGAKFVNKTQHENHASNLIAVHRRSIKELRLALRVPIVDADP